MEAPPTTELIAGKYQLVRMIGRGGMGSVWEGRHISLSTRVAIKFIEADHAGSAEARQRFDNEARAAATIQSKHAIQVYDHGLLSDGKPYIVMEFLSGEPLDRRLARMTTLSLQETARIVQHVARGLGRAHERGIIHRDLKPENIFLVPDEDEGGELAKVLDFGIAKISSDSLSISSNTKTGAILGTPYFMSPEQARGLKNIDHRSDIWSIGVIAYRCVTGQLPFDGESVGDLLVKICVSPLPVPSALNPNLPGLFNAWFAQCLEREPERRFATVNECASALAQLSGITSRGSVHSGQLRPVSIQNAPAVGAPFPQPGYTPSPFSGTPLPAARATSAGLSTSTSNLQPKSNRGALIAIGGIFALLGLGGGAVAIATFTNRPPVAPATFSPPEPPPPVSSPVVTATPTASESSPLTSLKPSETAVPSLTSKLGVGAGVSNKKGSAAPTARPTATATVAPTASSSAPVKIVPTKSTSAGF